MENKFTPGEWAYRPGDLNTTTNEGNVGSIHSESDDVYIAEVCDLGDFTGTYEKELANGKLLAAAPDMYEALQPFARLAESVVKDFEGAPDNTWVDPSENWGLQLGQFRNLLTALAKAEGKL